MEALNAMGTIYFDAGEFENALQYHEKALKFYPKNAPALLGKGSALSCIARKLYN